MRIPTRSAPPPPLDARSHAQSRPRRWNDSNDVFGSDIVPEQPVQKRKPPPRPPPPKLTHAEGQSQRGKQRKPTRPTELLSSLLGKRKQEHAVSVGANSRTSSTTTGGAQTSCAAADASVCLIDLSPPGSPTLTTRSSSDGVSVDSFGSDGNSNPSTFTSSGNNSQTESAFEDDFDFFGTSTKKLTQTDPWPNAVMSDPFGPLEDSMGKSQDILDDASTLSGPQSAGTSANAFPTTGKQQQQRFLENARGVYVGVKSIRSMPTIIRAKPPKPLTPKILQDPLKQRTCVTSQLQSRTATWKAGAPFSAPFSSSEPLDLSHTCNLAVAANDVNDTPSSSLPMPTIPPPLLPSYPLTRVGELWPDIQEPYGVALYDYPRTHPDDLSLKEGDVVKLTRRINDDWMVGQIGSEKGMFPCNFIDVKVPLPGIPDNVVTAIYPFKAEAPEDLSFNEGEKITVLMRISEDWLFGRCGTRKGQFPVNYVNRVPSTL